MYLTYDTTLNKPLDYISLADNYTTLLWLFMWWFIFCADTSMTTVSRHFGWAGALRIVQVCNCEVWAKMAERMMNGTSTRNDTGASGKRSEVAVILGAQWGDEGKGKIVDLLCQRADVVCRCQVCNVFSWREGYGNLLSYRYSCQQVSSLCQFASRHFALRPGYFAPGSFPIGTDRHQGKAICPKMEYPHFLPSLHLLFT